MIDIHSYLGECPTVVLGNNVDYAREKEVTEDMISGSIFTKLETPFFNDIRPHGGKLDRACWIS